MAKTDEHLGDQTNEGLPDKTDGGPADETNDGLPDGIDDDLNETTDDDLPEWEPLTPELVEDEAIRGDFMLRWAVVLLAFLLACTQIAETATLVHVKSGQYMAGHGWLPPRHDVFSYTAADRPWVNLPWLFDLAAAAVYAVGGAAGLSVIKAILAAVAFSFVVRISRPGVSTWWGSVSAALALLVCYPQFTARPEMVTLLGLALLLWWIEQWRSEEANGRLWLPPLLFLVWSNLDERVFLGLALLLLYATGEAVGHFCGRSGLPDPRRRKQLWAVLGACFAVSLVNPFGWNSLTAPLTLYGVEYPAMRVHWGIRPSLDNLQYYSLFDPAHWQALSHHTIAGLLLLVTAVVTFVLNRARLEVAHVFVFVGFVGFTLAAGRELAAAALVAGVLGTLNAQDWYRANFRQTYSVEASELLFSRGGRAVTVLALFAVAFLAIGGRLSGPDRRRIGIGFDQALRVHVDGMREDLEDTYDDRSFHFTIHQGDVLIWIDRRVFLDSRVAVYGRGGDDSLVLRHDRARRSMRNIPAMSDGGNSPDVWKDTFREFRLTHAIPRLTGSNPDYRTYADLLVSPNDWQLTRLGTATAVFHRNDLKGTQLEELAGYQDYLKTHEVNFLKEAFRTKSDESQPHLEWARGPSFYQKYLVRRRTNRTKAVQRAGHYYAHLQLQANGVLQLPPAIQAAFACLAIRDANTALATDPQNAQAYRILGGAYASLGSVEGLIARSSGVAYPNSMRFHQAVQAYHQALKIDPADFNTQWNLFRVYYARGKSDLALRALVAFEELTANIVDSTPEQIEQQELRFGVQQKLNRDVDSVRLWIDEELQNNLNRVEIAARTYQQGCVLAALELLENEPAIDSNPGAQLLQARLLMEAGRSEEAFDILGRLEDIAKASGMANWFSPTALSHLAVANYHRAITLWNAEGRLVEDQSLGLLLRTLPLAEGSRGWPLDQTRAAGSALFYSQDRVAELRFYAALCYIEAGQLDEATALLRRLLDLNPETPLRSLVRFYLFQLTEELIDIYPPSDRIPIAPDMFQPEPEDAPKPKTE